MKLSRILLLYILFLFVFQNGQSQNCCQVTTAYTPITETQANNLRKNYRSKYRIGINPAYIKKHSHSVDFSREAIIAFYEEFFINEPTKKFIGYTVNLVVFDDWVFPNQKEKRQIGLMISPANASCIPDSTSNVLNNSFDQSPSSHNKTPWVNRCDKFEYQRIRDNYRGDYPDNDKNHTKQVHFFSNHLKLFYDFLKNYPTYKGIRFYFMTYNNDNQVCGQATKNQITLLLVPVDQDGKADYSAFSKFVDEKNLAPKRTKNFMEAYNHGSLCPNYCPTE